MARVRELAASAKPCFVKRSGQAYLRFADGDYALSQLEIEGFISNRSRPRCDEVAVAGATKADFEADRVSDFLATARSSDRRLARITDDAELLRRAGVVGLTGEPTVAGLIGLGEYPQQFLPRYAIRIASLPDTPNALTRCFGADDGDRTRVLSLGSCTKLIDELAGQRAFRLLRASTTGSRCCPSAPFGVRWTPLF